MSEQAPFILSLAGFLAAANRLDRRTARSTRTSRARRDREIANLLDEVRRLRAEMATLHEQLLRQMRPDSSALRQTAPASDLGAMNPRADS